MKKFLLFAALIATAMSAKAQSFTVLHEGEIVANGATVICTTYNDETDETPEDNYGYAYDIVLAIQNDNMDSRDFTGTLLWGSYPTKEQLAEGNEFVGDYQYQKWGAASICNTKGTCFTPTDDTNLGKGDVSIPGLSSNTGFLYHLMSTPPELVSAYKTTIVPVDKPDEIFECTIVYAPTKEAAEEFIANAAVEDVNVAQDAAPVYYNINGMKVANPGKGLYIVKRGAKVTKEIIR